MNTNANGFSNLPNTINWALPSATGFVAAPFRMWAWSLGFFFFRSQLQFYQMNEDDEVPHQISLLTSVNSLPPSNCMHHHILASVSGQKLDVLICFYHVYLPLDAHMPQPSYRVPSYNGLCNFWYRQEIAISTYELYVQDVKSNLWRMQSDAKLKIRRHFPSIHITTYSIFFFFIFHCNRALRKTQLEF